MKSDQGKIAAAIIAIVALVGLLYFFGAFQKFLPEKMLEERNFKSDSGIPLFEQGEVLRGEGDISNFILSGVIIEGHIISEPVVEGDEASVRLAFKTKSGGVVKVNAVLGNTQEPRGVGYANAGDITGNEEYGVESIANIITLLRVGDPIQINLHTQDITTEVEEELLGNALCNGVEDKCVDFIAEVRKWHEGNVALVNAIENNTSLPNSHTIGAINTFLLYNDK